jgi:hypothetical protein
MKTLAQIRAANALAHRDRIAAGQAEGDVLSGFPMLIKQDGLLAAIALAVEIKECRQPDRVDARFLVRRRVGNQEQVFERKHKGEFSIAEAIAQHLRFNQPDGRISVTEARDPDGLVAELSGVDVSKLRRATAETLAFLNYLKRFVA